MIVELYIGTDKLDLFGDENIQITSAVADISDITKNLTDYSRNFTVPASETNNRIFKHYYDATIDNTFDARTKVSAYIYLDGVLFKQGKIQLNKVTIKKGKPSSYDLFFFGNLLNLTKLLSNDKLSVLDLSAFDHNYTSANVKQGLETSLFSGDLIYSLFAKKQYLYNSDLSNTTNTDNLVNIAWQGGANSNGIDYNTLRPSLKNIRIIEAIEAKYGLTFSRDFFGRSEFTDTFLWLNNTSEPNAGGGTLQVDFNLGSDKYVNFTTNTATYNIDSRNYFRIFMSVFPASGFENTPYFLRVFTNGNLDFEVEFVTATTQQSTLYSGNTETLNITYEVRSEVDFEFTTILRQDRYDLDVSSFPVEILTTSSTTQTINSNITISQETPDIKIIDYLKGLFQMFKLVVIPTSETELYVNTIQDYYKQGESFDITKYVDQENYSVERGELLNEINYSFEEPKAILNVEFEKQNNIFYGNEESTIRIDPNDPNSEQIDGKKEEYKVPFEVIVYNRLLDGIDDSETNIMYAPVFDEEIKPVTPAPHIHYNINQNLGAKTIGLIDELGSKFEVTKLNTPFHCEKIDSPNYSLLFSQELNEWNGSTMLNTLFSNHHAQYIAGIFNIKRRNYKYKAILPFQILTKISLDDVLKINDQFFRIDKYTTNLNTKVVDLELITAFDVNLNRVIADRTSIIVDFNAQTTSVFVTNLQSPTLTKIDTGFGVDWLTVTQVGGNIFFEFTENTLFNSRLMEVELVQGVFTITFNIFQEGTGLLTADNNTITVDNNTITADNG